MARTHTLAAYLLTYLGRYLNCSIHFILWYRLPSAIYTIPYFITAYHTSPRRYPGTYVVIPVHTRLCSVGEMRRNDWGAGVYQYVLVWYDAWAGGYGRTGRGFPHPTPTRTPALISPMFQFCLFARNLILLGCLVYLLYLT